MSVVNNIRRWFYGILLANIRTILILLILVVLINLVVIIHMLHIKADCTNGISKYPQNVQSTDEENIIKLKSCETIHIGIVSVGPDTNLFFYTLLKSIYSFRTNPLYFHVLVDDISRNVVSTLFKTWDVPQVNLSLYTIHDLMADVEWVQTPHYSGIYGLFKLIFPQVIPTYISKIIILDSDVVLNANILELWLLFYKFEENQCIGLIENESDFYLSQKMLHWPAISKGYNTGVMLYNLERMRNYDWNNMWRKIANATGLLYGFPPLADQDIINAIVKHNPDILFEVPCYWNVQLSDNSLSFNCYRNNVVKAIHWNSPRKVRVINKDGEYFRNAYVRFSEVNGNALKTILNNCSTPLEIQSVHFQKDLKNECYKFRQLASNKWRTFLFFRKFEYNSLDNDVTFTAQLSYDRLHLLDEIFQEWKGPMSLSFYVTDPEFQEVITFLNNIRSLKKRRNIGFHAVFKNGPHYPINLLRNIALKHVNTPYVFLVDIDFLPSSNLYMALQRYIAGTQTMYKKAFIVPAFETQKYKFRMPRGKKELVDMLENKTIYTFRHDVWASGQSPTDYTKWKIATTPYEVKWEPDFEPYVVVNSNVSKYNLNFMGFGWNKVSHIMELEAQAFDFIVLPDVFIIHKPHALSHDILKFRRSSIHRMCLRKLKEEFVAMLQAKYDWKFNNSGTAKDKLS